MELPVFYVFPIWAIGLAFFVVLLGAVETGYRVGLARRDKWKDADSGGGGVVLTSLFAVLGLVLAFTYASSVSRFDERKIAVLIEANALSTAFTRADIVLEPGRSGLKNALLEYARTRVIPPRTATSATRTHALVESSLREQENLWPATRHVIVQDNPVQIEAILVAAMNGVFDAHTVRLAAVIDRLPTVIIWLLLLVAAAALSVAGYNAGIQGLISRWRMSALAIVLTGIMLVILDLDRPTDGAIVVNQYSINTVVADMEADLRR